MFVINYLLSYINVIAGFGSIAVIIYIFALGVGSISGKMREAGKSNIMVELFCFVIWIPIIYSVWFLSTVIK